MKEMLNDFMLISSWIFIGIMYVIGIFELWWLVITYIVLFAIWWVNPYDLAMNKNRQRTHRIL